MLHFKFLDGFPEYFQNKIDRYIAYLLVDKKFRISVP